MFRVINTAEDGHVMYDYELFIKTKWVRILYIGADFDNEKISGAEIITEISEESPITELLCPDIGSPEVEDFNLFKDFGEALVHAQHMRNRLVSNDLTDDEYKLLEILDYCK